MISTQDDCGLHFGRAAFVTGAAQGIGLAVARAFLEHGASVAMADVQAEAVRRSADALADEFGDRTLALPFDVTDEDATERTAGAAVERFGKVDVAVPNAGVMLLRHAVDIDLDEWRHVIDVNLTGAFITARVLARRMLAQGGGGRQQLEANMRHWERRLGQFDADLEREPERYPALLRHPADAGRAGGARVSVVGVELTTNRVQACT